MMKVVPTPLRVSKPIVPLWSKITRSTIASPSPVPPFLVVK